MTNSAFDAYQAALQPYLEAKEKFDAAERQYSQLFGAVNNDFMEGLNSFLGSRNMGLNLEAVKNSNPQKNDQNPFAYQIRFYGIGNDSSGLISQDSYAIGLISQIVQSARQRGIPVMHYQSSGNYLRVEEGVAIEDAPVVLLQALAAHNEDKGYSSVQLSGQIRKIQERIQKFAEKNKPGADVDAGNTSQLLPGGLELH